MTPNPHPVGSPHYVITDAILRAERGETPAATLELPDGQTIADPQQALAWAQLTIKVEQARLEAMNWLVRAFSSAPQFSRSGTPSVRYPLAA